MKTLVSTGRQSQFGASLEAIHIREQEEAQPVGAVNTKVPNDESYILFMGIIDILQSYRLAKKMEHGWKSIFHDGDTLSMHSPSFYAKRFLDSIKKSVFTQIKPTVHTLSRRSKAPILPAILPWILRRLWP